MCCRVFFKWLLLFYVLHHCVNLFSGICPWTKNTPNVDINETIYWSSLKTVRAHKKKCFNTPWNIELSLPSINISMKAIKMMKAIRLMNSSCSTALYASSFPSSGKLTLLIYIQCTINTPVLYQALWPPLRNISSLMNKELYFLFNLTISPSLSFLLTSHSLHLFHQ